MKTWILAALFGLGLTMNPAHAALGSKAVIGADVIEGMAGVQNALPNGSFERGIAGPVASPALVSSTSTVFDGNRSVSWDSTSAAQTVTYTVAVPEWLKGKNAVLSCQFKCASGTCTHTIAPTDGTNTLATAATISSSTTSWLATTVNFPAPTSGNVAMKLTSVAADEPNLFIDKCFIADAANVNIGSISSVGSTVSTTLTPSAAFGVYTNGNYSMTRIGDRAYFRGYVRAGSPAASAAYFTLPTGIAIDPVKLTPSTATQRIGSSNLVVNSGTPAVSQTVFVFYDGSDTANVYLGMQSSSGTLTKNTGSYIFSASDGITFDFSIPVAGWSAETAYRPEQTAGSWSGYHDRTCAWTWSTTSYVDPTADTSCALVQRTNRNFGTVTSAGGSNALPGITFTPTRAGSYFVCAVANTYNGSANIQIGMQLTDGTTQVYEANQQQNTSTSNFQTVGCGIYYAASTSPVTLKLQVKASSFSAQILPNTYGNAVDWTIYQIDTATPAPLLVGSVTSNSSGLERVERMYINSACSASPCTVTSQSGNWLSSVTRSGTGTYVLNVNSGIFSAIPVCVAMSENGRVASMAGSGLTSTTIPISTYLSGSLSDSVFYVTCMGPR